MKKEFLTNKQKALLYLIHELSKIKLSSRFMIMKNLFLLKKEGNVDIKFYNFYPYNYGPFSRGCFNDLNTLRDKGYLDNNEKSPALTKNGINALKDIDSYLKEKIKSTIIRFDSDTKIKDYVYDNYPEYTIKSNSPRMKEEKEPKIFTIGYEGKDIDSFLDLLIKNNINMLIDVRKNAFSMNFSFTKNKLIDALKSVNINYLHIPELGIEGSKRKNLTTKADYKVLFDEYKKELPNKKEFINKIINLGKEKRVTLLCFEEDKNMCHRGVISNYLESNNLEVTHI